ncbi:MAG: TetR/AcrR family transcriptional regulator; helix-turn-helix transcriptional regulator [Rikenellaceae bacterium]|nr:TetR/AcrR family transcriptional regulator; helix-turn-helix transcriptional regulator [Rikenellaceae bacterium]
MEETILAAAEKLFLRNGYDLTSTTRIAKEAGCNQALVHYYFRTKEKLFQAVLEGKVKEVFQRFLPLETTEGTFEEKLTALIELHYDTIRKNSDMVLFLITELKRNPEMFHNIINQIGDLPLQTLILFKKDLDREIHSGRIRDISLQDLVVNIVSLNVFVFAAKPIFGKVWNIGDGEMETFYDERKKEIVKTILLSLRP